MEEFLGNILSWKSRDIARLLACNHNGHRLVPFGCHDCVLYDHILEGLRHIFFFSFYFECSNLLLLLIVVVACSSTATKPKCWNAKHQFQCRIRRAWPKCCSLWSWHLSFCAYRSPPWYSYETKCCWTTNRWAHRWRVVSRRSGTFRITCCTWIRPWIPLFMDWQMIISGEHTCRRPSLSTVCGRMLPMLGAPIRWVRVVAQHSHVAFVIIPHALVEYFKRTKTTKRNVSPASIVKVKKNREAQQQKQVSGPILAQAGGNNSNGQTLTTVI